MKTEEGNILIWDFMGRPLNDFRRVKPDMMNYHKSWDWLMPVVEKIDNIDRFSKWCELENFCINRIDKVFSSAVKFIEWYNENNK